MAAAYVYCLWFTTVKGTSNIADIDNLSSKDDLILVLLFESGFVTDDEVTHRESKLKDALKNDPEFQLKEGASVEVAQVIDEYLNETTYYWILIAYLLIFAV